MICSVDTTSVYPEETQSIAKSLFGTKADLRVARFAFVYVLAEVFEGNLFVFRAPGM